MFRVFYQTHITTNHGGSSSNAADDISSEYQYGEGKSNRTTVIVIQGFHKRIGIRPFAKEGFMARCALGMYAGRILHIVRGYRIASISFHFIGAITVAIIGLLLLFVNHNFQSNAVNVR